MRGALKIVLILGTLTIASIAALALYEPRFALSEMSRSPSREHPLGTTPSGADVANVCLAAAIHTASWAFLATAGATILGICIGLRSGMRKGGILDRTQLWLARIIDSIGPILAAACLASAIPRAPMAAYLLLVWLLTWTTIAGITRVSTLQVMSAPWYEGCVAAGFSTSRLLFRHILPEIIVRLSPAMFGLFGGLVGLYATLGFLGIQANMNLNLGHLLWDSMAYLSSTKHYFWSVCASTMLLLITASFLDRITARH